MSLSVGVIVFFFLPCSLLCSVMVVDGEPLCWWGEGRLCSELGYCLDEMK